jgi:hypothetical protein
MTKEPLQKQADRADEIAEQTVDEEVKKGLRDAAKHYRAEARSEEFKPKPDSRLPEEIS